MDARPKGGRIEFSPQTCINPLVLVKMIQTQPTRYRLEGATQLRFQGPMEHPDDRFNTLEALLERLTPAATG